MDKRETKNPFLSRVRNGCERVWIFTLTDTSGYEWMRQRITDYPWISVEILWKKFIYFLIQILIRKMWETNFFNKYFGYTVF
jgi:hypothetical protein